MRIVVKVGTSTLAHPNGLLNIRRVEELCKVLSDLKNAGNDLILVKYRKSDEKLINKITKTIKDEKEIDEHIERILKLKEKYNINQNKETKKCDIKKINEKIKKIKAMIKQQGEEHENKN